MKYLNNADTLNIYGGSCLSMVLIPKNSYLKMYARIQKVLKSIF